MICINPGGELEQWDVSAADVEDKGRFQLIADAQIGCRSHHRILLSPGSAMKRVR